MEGAGGHFPYPMPDRSPESALEAKARKAILGHEEGVSRADAPAALVAAAYLLGAGPSASFGESQKQLRISWERVQRGILKQFADNLSLPGQVVADEGEHRVHYDEITGLACKCTNNQRFGSTLDQAGASLKLEPRDALPSEYLWRLGLHNALFHDDIQLIGIGVDVYGVPTIQTSQPWLAGATPAIGEIRRWMEERDFRQIPRQMLVAGVPSVLSWYRFADEILVYDTKPANFVKQGDTLDPIDLCVSLYPKTLIEETARANGVENFPESGDALPPGIHPAA